mmetsp:Transcript_12291/g.34534  ORF Transcript_12291/g.34534 Transcript_12291/m.34534 type:complete len:274 (-) Transcript_12291:307-1128(-)
MTDSGSICFKSTSLRWASSWPSQNSRALSWAPMRAVRDLRQNGLEMKSLAPAMRLFTTVSVSCALLTITIGMAAQGYFLRISWTVLYPRLLVRFTSMSIIVGKLFTPPRACRSARMSRHSSEVRAEVSLKLLFLRDRRSTEWYMRSSSTDRISTVRPVDMGSSSTDNDSRLARLSLAVRLVRLAVTWSAFGGATGPRQVAGATPGKLWMQMAEHGDAGSLLASFEHSVYPRICTANSSAFCRCSPVKVSLVGRLGSAILTTVLRTTTEMARNP